jgi:hypothetical protein
LLTVFRIKVVAFYFPLEIWGKANIDWPTPDKRNSPLSERFIQRSVYLTRRMGGIEGSAVVSSGQEFPAWISGLSILLASFKFEHVVGYGSPVHCKPCRKLVSVDEAVCGVNCSSRADVGHGRAGYCCKLGCRNVLAYV